MSRQGWVESLAWATADGTAVANTTTEAILFPNITIPAGFMQDGRTLRLKAYGRWSNVVTAVPTLTFFIRHGGVSGTILAQSGAIVTPAAAQTNAQWSLEALLQTRVNGSTGTIFAQGRVMMSTTTVPTFGTVTHYGVWTPLGSAGMATPAAVTVDLSADWALALSADWSAADAANSITGHIYTCEAMN